MLNEDAALKTNLKRKQLQPFVLKECVGSVLFQQIRVVETRYNYLVKLKIEDMVCTGHNRAV